MLPPDRIHNQPEHTIPTVKKGRKGRLTGTLIAAGAAAVVSVYSIGYINTEADSDPYAAVAPAATVAAATATPNTAQVPGITRQQPGATAPRATATPVPSTTNGGSTQTGAYKDGTYIGNGTSRHGGMQVTVVISGGKITSAAITSCNTRYPCSDVASLVTAVVAQQAAPVNHVSGATDSSNAYKQAVSAALGQARSAA